MQRYNVDTMMFPKKKLKNNPENIKKKTALKFAHYQPPIFFSLLARLPKRPKNRNPVPPKAPYCRTGYLDWEITRI